GWPADEPRRHASVARLAGQRPGAGDAGHRGLVTAAGRRRVVAGHAAIIPMVAGGRVPGHLWRTVPVVVAWRPAGPRVAAGRRYPPALAGGPRQPDRIRRRTCPAHRRGV